MAGRWMLKFAMIGLVGAVAAAASAKAVLTYGHVDLAAELRPAQVVADQTRSRDAVHGGSRPRRRCQVIKAADGHYWAEAWPSTARPCTCWSTPAPRRSP